MEQPTVFFRNVLLLKNSDLPRINGQVYVPTQSERSTIRNNVQLEQYKRKVGFDASMSSDMIRNKLEETFPYLKNRR